MSCDFISLATEGVRTLKPYQPGKPVEEIERELGLRDVVKLASNESPLGPGTAAREAAAHALENVSRYPDGNGTVLKQTLARKLGVGEDRLTLGNGSNDVLELAVRAFVTPEHEVIFSEHAFAVYPLATQAVSARAVVTPAKDWGHDPEAMAKGLTDRTRVIFIANPNNPTGTWVDTNSLERLIRSVPEHVIVVVDEAYCDYVEAPDYPDCVSWLERYPNLVVTRTFSKAYGLAGLRVGYAVSHPQVADLMNRVRQPFNVNSVALAAAAGALEDDEHLSRSVAVNKSGMAQLTEAFDAMGLDYIPSAGNFVSVNVGRRGSQVFEALLKRGVIVRPVDNYGMPEHLRVTVGLEQENVRFLEALAKVLSPRGRS
ncbi:MAG: histidinol-phosphate transaminase [Gammaproteobacteria bacterium]|nr:histidinol-phosphate transaminase [Gammaproteobacteria bacterium]NIR82476.1 histidinol-phosphate transaminase [Gammaproteobacteria bacterium]NIR88472.1 histidinol-phosphate transaminase [Gammaproteobacteria bacterium]NIU03612.1 histidinol-phosphate transaminase [Gammaproteobacteria bacterium]NIV50964.1 histidinol-phosphate transaminase [Gammaproteobacteria bacterium]